MRPDTGSLVKAVEAVGTASTVSAVELRHMSKHFGASRALVDVSLELRPGEVHGLVGANGSGKSTLVKILAGYHTPEPGGTARLHGHQVGLPLRPAALDQARVGFVHQDLGLVDDLTVLENLWLTRLAQAHVARLPWRELHRRGEVLLERYNVSVPLDRQAADLSQAQRALLAITRAAATVAGTLTMSSDGEDTSAPSGVLVLDEATVYLSGRDRELLQRIVAQVTADRGAVLVITHDLDEAIALSDRILVLRDGRAAALLDRGQADRAELAALIVGHPVTVGGSAAGAAEHGSAPVPAEVTEVLGAPGLGDNPADLRVTGMRAPRHDVADVSFSVRSGEILGFAGLVGSGFDQVGALVFGARRADGGVLTVGSRELPLAGMTPALAIDAGLAYIPAGRGSEGLMLDLSVQENLMAQVVDRYFRAGFLRHRAMRARALEVVSELDVRCRSLDMVCSELSGGNQQKVLLGKWLESGPPVLVLNEPTQGIDVGAREMIWQTLRRLAADGLTVLCASSDHEELAQLATRVLVLRRGVVVETLSGGRLTKSAITAASLV